MKKALMICFFLGVLHGQPEVQSISFVRQFGSPQVDEGRAVAADATGVYIVGMTRGVLPGQNRSDVIYDAFIRKYDAAGNERWTRQFGLPRAAELAGVTAHHTGIYVVGIGGSGRPEDYTHAFLRKYTATGSEAWTREVAFSYGYDSYAYGVTADETGIYVLGVIVGPVPKGAEFHPTLWKYDFSGNRLWAHSFTDAGEAGYDYGITVDGNGVYIVGSVSQDTYIWKYDTNGNEIWVRDLASGGLFKGITTADATGVYIFGVGGLIRKYDSNGSELWAQPSGQQAAAISATADSTGVYVVGEIWSGVPGESDLDGFIAKYDNNGRELWTNHFGSSAFDIAAGVAVNGAGVYAAGWTYGVFPGQSGFPPDVFDFAEDAFLARFEKTTGTPVASIISADPAFSNPRMITTDGPTLFVVNQSSVPDKSNILSMSIAGGTVKKLYTGLRSPSGITTLGNSLFWIDPNSGPVGDTQILAAPKDASGPFHPIYTGSSVGQPILDGSGITTDGTSFFTVDAFQGRVHRLNPDGSGLALLVSRFPAGAEHFQQIDESSGVLYIVDAKRPGVSSLPKTGGAFTPLHIGAPFVCPSAIAVRRDSAPGPNQLFVADPCTNTLWGLPTYGGTPIALLSGPPLISIDGLVFDSDVLYASDSGNSGGVDGPGAIYRIVPRLCDPDWNGHVDSSDIGQILAARNTAASGPNDPRDINKDGLITIEDARKCALWCTKPNCLP